MQLGICETEQIEAHMIISPIVSREKKRNYICNNNDCQ